MPITQTITTLPAAPSSSDPSTFETKADAFVAALPALVTEINTWADQADALAVTVNADAVAAESAKTAAQLAETNAETAETNAETAAATATAAAISAVNSPGTFGTYAGSLTIGAGPLGPFVTQTGKTWVLGQTVSVTRDSDPVNYRAWGIITAYNSGSGSMTINIESGNFTIAGTFAGPWTISLTGPEGQAGEDALITAPKRVITTSGSITASDNGYNLDVTAAGVTLTPDTAAAMDETSCIINAVGYDVTVVATFNDGETSKTLVRGTSVVLSSNGTSFRWQLNPIMQPKFGALASGVVTSSVNSQSFVAATALSSTRAMVFHKGASGYPYVSLVSETGAVIGISSALESALPNVSSFKIDICKVNATTALAVWQDDTSKYIRACAISYSGSTVTAGTTVAIGGTDTANGGCSVSLLDTDKVLCVWNRSGAGTMHAQILTLSGTSITTNTIYTIDTGMALAANATRSVAISTSQMFAAWSAATSAVVGKILTVSGTVITQSSLLQMSSISTPNKPDFVFADNKVIFATGCSGSTPYGELYSFEISGTGTGATVIFNRQSLIMAGDQSLGQRLAKVSDKSVLRFTKIGGSIASGFVHVLGVNDGSVMELNTSKSIGNLVDDYSIVVCGRKVLVIYADAGNSYYPTVKSLDLGTIY